MLSSPPPRLAPRTSSRTASSTDAAASTVPAITSSGTIVVRPSEQRRKTSPGAASTTIVSTSTRGSVPSARVMTDRCGWASASSGVSRPLRMRSPTSEWSSVSCSSSTAAQPVGARVADVADDDPASGEERGRDRRPHPRDLRVGLRPLVDAAVRLLDDRLEPLLRLEGVGIPGTRGTRPPRAATRPPPPARRPCRPRRRTAADRGRTRPRFGGAPCPRRSCRRSRPASSLERQLRVADLEDVALMEPPRGRRRARRSRRSRSSSPGRSPTCRRGRPRPGRGGRRRSRPPR